MPPPPAGSLRGAVDLSSLVNRAQSPAGASGVGGAAAGAGASGEPGQGGANPLLLEGSDANFTQIIELSNTVPVIVDLKADWAEASRELTAVLTAVVTSYAGRLVYAGVDAQSNPQLAQAFQAQSVPTVAAIVAGRPVSLFQGSYPEEEVRSVLEQVLQLAAQNGVTGTVPLGDVEAEGEQEPVEEPLPPHHAEAYDAIARGDYAAAIAEYQTAIAQNPRDALAVAGLAQVKLLSRLDGHTLDDIRAAAATNPDDLDAQLLVADLDLSGGHIDDSFGRLLDLFPKAAPDEKTTIRTRLLDLFEVVGADDPRVAAARRRLAALLY
ncbi:tetratricopeptide repeat protein [Herbiconiux moechotypicola]|uniref:Tetratricopeptide repeat protein n=2 Tax=Herbiconiux moechotypicola TaxID=637393 RepID=A0ABP5QCZ5_9MICO|nr:tetratricopeptide repeat protein [Herbiconiux moechotypicola]MCS5729769.1 tetratricopeptide repeat protein [Herbiconiux moechotypicola]